MMKTISVIRPVTQEYIPLNLRLIIKLRQRNRIQRFTSSCASRRENPTTGFQARTCPLISRRIRPEYHLRDSIGLGVLWGSQLRNVYVERVLLVFAQIVFDHHVNRDGLRGTPAVKGVLESMLVGLSHLSGVHPLWAFGSTDLRSSGFVNSVKNRSPCVAEYIPR